MGDDELNFTEEEARSWANDPHNQARPDGLAIGIVSFCVPVVMMLLGLILATGAGTSPPDRAPGSGAQVSYERVEAH